MPEIQMPKLSDTMTEGTLVAWKKKKGDKVAAGDVIAEIETDKATMEWESPEDGTLTEIYVEEGGKVEVGEKIAFIGGEGETAPKAEKKKEPEAKTKEEKGPAKKKEQAETEKPAPAEDKEPETAPPQEDEKRAETKTAPSSKPPAEPKSESSGEARVKASPIARRLAAEEGLDLSTIKGTGPDGRVTENDVRAVAKSKGGAAASKPAGAQHIPAGEGSRISLSGMRKVIAERLVASKGPVPHFYLNIEVDAGPLMSARAELKSAGEKSDSSKITVNDFVLKAAVEAAVKVPKANASFDGDAIVQYNDVNLGIAVALEEGLVTPVIRAAQGKSLREISEAVKDLAQRARNKRMKPEEFQGGTFTVSNLGSYGIEQFYAIVNPPQAAILAVGAIVKKAVVNAKDEIVVGQRMNISLSGDHRVVDGAVGAEYITALRKLIENPALMLF
jgi:pyruvate dehydrogenase E2 component (dihydrolipoamide acetyltransferase)